MDEKLIRPALFRLEAETGARIGVSALRCSAGSRGHSFLESWTRLPPREPSRCRFGLNFPNAVACGRFRQERPCVAGGRAGLWPCGDRNGHGSPQRQSRPAEFRYPAEQAVITGWLQQPRRQSGGPLGHQPARAAADPVGINLGKSKRQYRPATQDYLALRPAGRLCRLPGPQLSSPNTPGCGTAGRGAPAGNSCGHVAANRSRPASPAATGALAAQDRTRSHVNQIDVFWVIAEFG